LPLPATGQPDFAAIRVDYVPDKKAVESKSFKFYLWSYRDQGVFHEHLVNLIMDDLIKALNPHYIKVTGTFNIRDGHRYHSGSGARQDGGGQKTCGIKVYVHISAPRSASPCPIP
jgi:7-cyano-7-deazaguanine reductase